MSIWNDSFCDLTLEEKSKIVKMNSNEVKKYEIKNNTLFFSKTFLDEIIIYSINEIDNYSLEPLMDYSKSRGFLLSYSMINFLTYKW